MVDRKCSSWRFHSRNSKQVAFSSKKCICISIIYPHIPSTSYTIGLISFHLIVMWCHVTWIKGKRRISFHLFHWWWIFRVHSILQTWPTFLVVLYPQNSIDIDDYRQFPFPPPESLVSSLHPQLLHSNIKWEWAKENVLRLRISHLNL